jgi:hypothetical protein
MTRTVTQEENQVPLLNQPHRFVTTPSHDLGFSKNRNVMPLPLAIGTIGVPEEWQTKQDLNPSISRHSFSDFNKGVTMSFASAKYGVFQKDHSDLLASRSENAS